MDRSQRSPVIASEDLLAQNRILLFTKSWPEKTPGELADFVGDLGFDGVELTVREGYPVNPGNALAGIPRAARAFRDRDLAIGAIAGSLDEGIIRGMGEAGIPLLRMLPALDLEKGYFRSVQDWRDRLDQFRPLLEENNVRVGLQNHLGNFPGGGLALHHMLTGVPETIAGAVLDIAHCELAGEPLGIALDIITDRLLMINFKNGYRHRINGPDEEARWQTLWTTADHGAVSWKDAVEEILSRDIDVDICCHAEYRRVGMTGQLYGDEVVPLISSDLVRLKNLLDNS